MFGTMLTLAQTTQKKDNMKSKAEKNLKSTEMKLDTSVQPNNMNRTLDTSAVNDRSKMQENSNTLQAPKNSTPESPTTMPQNSTAKPQVQPVSPVEPSKPAQ